MRIVILSLLLAITATVTMAKTEREILRDHVLAGDIAAVEAQMKSAHMSSLSGAISYDDLRDLFRVFSTTDPRVWEFAVTWIDHEPESAYAHAAKLWLDYVAGGLARRFGKTYTEFPPAQDIYRRHMGWALYHAERSSDLAPDLVPATDGVLRLQARLRMMNRKDFWDYLDGVMDLTPSYGSLLRASFSIPGETGPGHFDDPAVFQFCNRFAPRVSNQVNYSPEICRVDIAVAEHFDQDVARAWAEALVASDHPVLQDNKIAMARSMGMSPFQTELVEYLAEDDNTDIEAATTYALNNPSAQAYTLYEKVFRRAHQSAIDNLEYDPYDPFIIDILLKDHHPGQLQIENTLSNLDRRYLIARKLVVSPYDPWSWWGYARTFRVDETGAQRPVSEWLDIAQPYLANMVVYSWHDLDALSQYHLTIKHALNKVDRDLSRKEITPVQAELARDPLVCPFIRLSRLIEHNCETFEISNRSECRPIGQRDEMLESLIERSARSGECRKARATDIRSLFFEEQAVDLPRHEDIMSVTIKR